MSPNQADIISVLAIGVLCLSIFASIDQKAVAQEILLSDNFTSDKSLNSSLWQINGFYGTSCYNFIKSGLPSMQLVNANPVFSDLGMCISDVNSAYQLTTIESENAFYPPVTIQAQVAVTQSEGVPFGLWIDNIDRHNVLGIDGVLNPKSPQYGIWSHYNGQPSTTAFYASPQLNTTYQLTINVDATGENTLSISANGKNLGSTSMQSVGTGQLKIIIIQREQDADTTGTGPNQAYWKSITVTNIRNPTPTSSPQPTVSISATPSSKISSTTPSPTVTLSPSPASAPSSLSSATATTVPSTSPSSPPSVSISPIPSNATPPAISASSTPFAAEAIVLLLLAAFSLTTIGVFVYVTKRRKRNAYNGLDKAEKEKSVGSQASPNRMLIPLGIASFSTGLSNAIISLFVIDIARTFFGSPTTIAISSVSQLSTINMAAEVVVTIILSVLVIKFRHKHLFLVGAAFISVSAVGSFFAPNLMTLQFFIALEGAGSIVISIVAAAFVADSLPPEKRAKTISYLFSIGAAVTLVMVPFVGLITEMGGWRYGLSVLVLPISLLGLLLSLFMLPSKPVERCLSSKTNPYVEGFRQILKSKSATACLVANLLTVAGTEVAVFALAFYRIQFSATRELTVMVYEVAVLFFILAPLFSGRLVSKFGAKRVALSSTFLAACFTAVFFFVPNLWVAITLDMMHVWFAAMALPAFACLILEQVPSYRGTMFSLNSFFNSVGKTLAPLIGGILLVSTAGLYSSVGIALGGMTIMGCLVLFFLVTDYAKSRPNS